MNTKLFALIALASVLIASSGTVQAHGAALPTLTRAEWSLPRQALAATPVGVAAASGNLRGEVNPAVTFGSIVNGNFEQGSVVWSQSSSNSFPLILSQNDLPVPTYSGSYAAWLGGGEFEQSVLTQTGITITKPASILHFWYIIGSEAACGGDFGFVHVNGSLMQQWALCTANNSSAWTELTIDLGAFDGQVVTLMISVVTDGIGNSNLFVDAVSLGGSFSDVTSAHPYFGDIEILYANGLTGGCNLTPLMFCPDQIMDRAQAAVFMTRGELGAGYSPNPAENLFQDDWSPGSWARPWAEAMRQEGLTSGCSITPLLYCPWQQLPREQVVIFGLKMKYGVGYQPPPASGTVFADLTDVSYYATPWAEKAYADGLIEACGVSGGKPLFCPSTLVTRGLGAYVIVRAKSLTMP